MLTSPDPAMDELCQEALNRLKGKENPFESLVRPQKGDVRFRDLDVPSLLRGPREQLLHIIDSYRIEDYTGASDLRPTRVVLIRGERGSGKTHLLRSLQHRPDERSQILVRPAYFEGNLPFEEYLHSQLVGVLLEEDEVYSGKPFEDISRALTRRLLRQAVLALGPTDRIASVSPGRWRRLLLLWGGGDRFTRRYDELAQDLAAPAAARDLPTLVRKRGLSPAQGLRLIEGHLKQHERGKDPLIIHRQRLYSAMARYALLNDEEAIRHFLEGQHLPPDSRAGLRFETVSRLLHVLTEACALERFPIVVAFDNLERLLSPQNRFDPELTRAFLRGLAQATDNTRGVLLLLFAEHGLFDSQIAPNIDSFVYDRLRQGVPLHAQGPVTEITLTPPSLAEITALIRARIKERLLADLPGVGKLPDHFPYSEGFVGDVLGGGAGKLRDAIQRLRDQYNRTVYQRDPETVETTKDSKDWTTLFNDAWKSALASAARKLEESKVAHAQALHAGLGLLLQQVVPLKRAEWELRNIQPGVTIGEHPTYGLITLLDWQAPGTQPPTNGGHLSWRVGVGLLLAVGGGMPPDLRAKFGLFKEKTIKCNSLLILWPRPVDAEDLTEALPRATREAWDESLYRSKTRLGWLSFSDLCAMLAFPDWLDRIKEESGGQASPSAIRDFVLNRCESLFLLVQPMQIPRTERTTIHED